jgi:hypothetical protein
MRKFPKLVRLRNLQGWAALHYQFYEDDAHNNDNQDIFWIQAAGYDPDVGEFVIPSDGCFLDLGSYQRLKKGAMYTLWVFIGDRDHKAVSYTCKGWRKMRLAIELCLWIAAGWRDNGFVPRLQEEGRKRGIHFGTPKDLVPPRETVP